MDQKTVQVAYFIVMLVGFSAGSAGQAQAPHVPKIVLDAPDHPAVTVHGKTYTPRTILSRNQGTGDEDANGDMLVALKPHKIIDNVYYVGTKTLSGYLITTPAGNIVIDTNYERAVVPVLKKSIEELGFKFQDTKFILGNHAHGDHQEGDALVKELTAAQVLVMAEDVAAVKNIKPGGKEHPVDRIIHDGDTLALGGTTLTAHLTGGHSPGCTTWTMKAKEGGKSYDVVFHCSLRPPNRVTPELQQLFARTFKVVRALPCDVPLGDHTETYGQQAKAARVRPGAPNPYIDPAGCNVETDVEEAMLAAIVKEQESAKGK